MKPFTTTIAITIAPAPDTASKVRALQHLTDLDMLGRLAQLVMAETLVPAYQRRFESARAVMGEMMRIDDTFDARRVAEIRRLDQEFHDAVDARNFDRAVALSEDLTKARSHGSLFEDEVLRVGGEGYTLLVEGMAQVLVALSEVHLVKQTGHAITLGIGPLNGAGGLNSIETPSYSVYRRGKTTRSPFRILWKQLEYGSGAFARPKQYKSSWWYGRGFGGKAGGLHIRGSHGGHFLRAASGLPYESDAQQFQSAFVERMMQLLMG